MATTSRPPVRANTLRTYVPALRAMALVACALSSAVRALGAQEARTGTLSGTVVDQASNRPVADVIVLVRGTQVGTSTSADGRFRMVLPAGAHTLVIRHLAYG